MHPNDLNVSYMISGLEKSWRFDYPVVARSSQGLMSHTTCLDRYDILVTSDGTLLQHYNMFANTKIVSTEATDLQEL